jgi:hypothetical protein
MNFQAGARFQAIFGLALRRSRRLQKRSYGAARPNLNPIVETRRGSRACEVHLMLGIHVFDHVDQQPPGMNLAVAEGQKQSVVGSGIVWQVRLQSSKVFFGNWLTPLVDPQQGLRKIAPFHLLLGGSGTGWKTSCVRLHEFPYPSFHCELGRELSLHAQVGSSC